MKISKSHYNSQITISFNCFWTLLRTVRNLKTEQSWTLITLYIIIVILEF